MLMSKVSLFILMLVAFAIHISFCVSSVGINYNTKLCKLTITGFEYTGITGRSSAGYKCKPWDGKYANNHVDEDFIDGSRKLAKALCRNPNNSPKGPWCHTSNPDVRIDYCNIPLCHFPECRASSTGSEYGGVLSKSVAGLECHAWEVSKSELKSDSAFPEANFPSGSLGPEGRSCRNPNGNSGGPWCWVKPDQEAMENEENFTNVEGTGLVAELCDVPYCNEPDCMTFVSAPSSYTHYVSISKSFQNFTFSFKPWLMDKWVPNKIGHYANIFLSTSPSPYSPGFELKLPLYGKDVMELRYIGYGENREGIHLTMGAEESEDEDYIMEKIINWSKYQITWSEDNFVVHKFTNKGNEVQSQVHLLYEPEESTYSKEQKEDLKNLNYISMSGEPSLWSGDCDESQCPVHTVIDSGLYHWERLRLDATGTHVKFNARGFKIIGIELASSPVDIGPRLKILIGEKNHTTVSYVNMMSSHVSSYQIIDKSSSEVKITYWEWKDFTVSLFGDRIAVYASPKETAIDQMQTLLETRHSSARLMRWFSPYSPQETVSHWTFFCSPQEEDEVPEALPPECITSLNAMATEKYMGNQWVSQSGMPCLPWVDPTIVDRLSAFKHHFPDQSPWHAGNSCRNPTGGPLGPWCYRLLKDVKDSSGRMKMKAEACGVRACRYEDCRMSGIGTDYIGNLNQTITGRTCQRWDSSFPHEVLKTLQNSSLYADQDIVKANNFCRNPSRNIAGPWCYTSDPKTPADVCDIRDCVNPEACTVLVRGAGEGRLLYILPHWKTQGLSIWLKEWDPDHTDGLVFILRPLEGERYYKLVIGADDNQKVKMFYKNESGEHLVKEKTVNYVVPAGRWGGFNLKVGHGWLILSYEGVSSDQRLFEWIHYYDDESDKPSDSPFTPFYLTFTSYLGHTIGLHFYCWECHIEKTSTDSFTKLVPIRRPLNSTTENSTHLEFLLRGNGVALIPLMSQPGRGDYYGVTIGERQGNSTYLIRKQSKKRIRVLARASLPQKLLRLDRWTRFNISYNETNIRLSREGQIMIDFESEETLLFYWFSLGSENGEITWASNCLPVDIDGDPRNGGWSSWSPWQCSATCGGGVGRRERQCTNPTPNVLGHGCEGQPMVQGPCNRFFCGEVSPRIVSRLRDNLRRKYAGVVAEEGKAVVLPCGNLTGSKLLEEAMGESPNSTVGWTKDGSHLIHREGLKVLDNYDLELKNVTPDDSGVYVCILWQIIEEGEVEVVKKKKGLKEKVKNFFKGMREKVNEVVSSDKEQEGRVVKPLTLSVASLAVTRTSMDSNATVSIRETRVVRLPCRALALGLVYGDLRLRWYLNGTLWKDYGFISPDVISEESLVAGKEHRGVWTCVASQPDLQFVWTTNWILLEVKPPPNFFSMLLEDGLTAPIFRPLGSETSVIIVFFCMLAFIFVLICVSKCLIIRYYSNKKTE